MNRTVELLVAALLIAILVSDFMYTRELSSYASHEQHQYGNKTEHDKQKSRSPLLSVIADIEEFLEAHEKTLIVLSTIAIALFTGTLWRATTGLQELAVRQSNDMKESVRISNESAKAAKRTVETMEDTARKDLRAYVALEDMYFRWKPDPDDPKGRKYIVKEHDDGKPPRPRIRIRNVGKTPARNVTVRLNGMMVQVKRIDPEMQKTELIFEKTYERRNYPAPRQMLAPGQPYGVWVHLQGGYRFPHDPAYDPDKEALIVHGAITYQDIFDRWWITRFCYTYDGKNRFLPHTDHHDEREYKSEKEALDSLSYT